MWFGVLSLLVAAVSLTWHFDRKRDVPPGGYGGGMDEGRGDPFEEKPH